MSRFSRYRVGCLWKPRDLDEWPVFALKKGQRLISPCTIDLRDWDLPPKDQGDTSMCAAYAAASYAENILWRKSSRPTQIEPEWIYKCAKSLDGMPDADGTSLIAVLEALLVGGIFGKEYCEVKTLKSVANLKYAVHKYGTCLVGMAITKEYYDCTSPKRHTICGKGNQTPLGGHAMQCVGFNRDGVICRNSWGADYAYDGNIIIAWPQFEEQFVYGATLDNPLWDMHLQS